MRSWPALLIVLASGCAPAAPSPPPASTPLPSPAAAALPAVDLATLDGHATRIDALRGGKAALVTFWAPWCDSCVTEFDALNRLDDRARQSGGVVIGVAVGETPNSAAELAKRHHLRYEQLVDEDFHLTDALGQRRLPTTLVVSREGRILYSGGALDEKALAAFRAALGG